jgi:hypothetical protein
MMIAGAEIERAWEEETVTVGGGTEPEDIVDGDVESECEGNMTGADSGGSDESDGSCAGANSGGTGNRGGESGRKD